MVPRQATCHTAAGYAPRPRPARARALVCASGGVRESTSESAPMRDASSCTAQPLVCDTALRARAPASLPVPPLRLVLTLTVWGIHSIPDAPHNTQPDTNKRLTDDGDGDDAPAHTRVPQHVHCFLAEEHQQPSLSGVRPAHNVCRLRLRPLYVKHRTSTRAAPRRHCCAALRGTREGVLATGTLAA
jgi:hypothetical protein